LEFLTVGQLLMLILT